MDAAYDDNTTLQLVLDFGYLPSRAAAAQPA